MSENVLEIPASQSLFTSSEKTSWVESSEFDDFNYVPLSPWAPLAFVLGALSLTGFLGIFGLYLAFVSVIICLIAVSQIRKAEGIVKGVLAAYLGLILASFSLVVGSVSMYRAYQTECPEGFQRVNFSKDISDWQFLYTPRRELHPAVAPLEGKKIFLKGFMWQTEKADGLTEFLLLKDNGECCFGGKAQPYDMMRVKLLDGKTTRAYIGMVAVAGTLKVNLEAGEDAPVYTVDATMVEEARTRF